MNWGTKIILGMVAFMLFILTLVFMMVARHGDDGLVDENYYEEGQLYDAEMKLKADAVENLVQPVLINDKNGITIKFTEPATYKIYFRRSSDEALDQSFESRIALNELKLSRGDLNSGPWHVRIEYEQGGTKYLHEEKIIIP